MSGTFWRRVCAALAVVLVVLLVALGLVLVRGNKVLPWTTASERHTQQYDTVRQAASRAVLAFTAVDYRHIDQSIARLEAVSTGTFKQQYKAATTNVRATVQQAKSISTGTVRYTALNSLSPTHAVVLVGADTVVKSTATATQKKTADCPHSGARCDKYRFVVQLDRTSTGWKMSNLMGVS